MKILRRFLKKLAEAGFGHIRIPRFDGTFIVDASSQHLNAGINYRKLMKISVLKVDREKKRRQWRNTNYPGVLVQLSTQYRLTAMGSLSVSAMMGFTIKNGVDSLSNWLQFESFW